MVRLLTHPSFAPACPTTKNENIRSRTHIDPSTYLAGEMSKEDAEMHLNNAGVTGAFLVRESPNGGSRLSIKLHGSIMHLILYLSEDGVSFHCSERPAAHLMGVVGPASVSLA